MNKFAQNSSSILLIFILFLSLFSHDSQATKSCKVLILAEIPKQIYKFLLTAKKPSLVLTEKSYRELQNRIEQSDITWPTYLRKHDFIYSVEKSIQTDRGRNNAGVFRVKTSVGEAALKIYIGKANLEKLVPIFIIQQFLAELGIAPRVMGIIPREELTKIMDREPLLEPAKKNIYDSYSFALVMEEIVGAWNFSKSTKISPPTEVSNWNKNSVFQKIKRIESALNVLRIRAYDTQLVISSKGEVLLIDIDDFTWTKPNGEILSYFLDRKGIFPPDELNDFEYYLTRLGQLWKDPLKDQIIE